MRRKDAITLMKEKNVLYMVPIVVSSKVEWRQDCPDKNYVKGMGEAVQVPRKNWYKS